METTRESEPFSGENMYEEEFEIVPLGQGSIKNKVAHPHGAYWQFAIIILTSTLAFMLGRLDLLNSKKPPIRIEQQGALVNSRESTIPNTVSAQIVGSSKTSQNPPIPGGFVASKNGTKYYIPTCGGVSRIKDENKIWFATKVEAEKAGYEPAANCPGL